VFVPFVAFLLGGTLWRRRRHIFVTIEVMLTVCHALSPPRGLTTEGLLVGMQIIGSSHADAAVITAASRLEREFGNAGCLPIGPVG